MNLREQWTRLVNQFRERWQAMSAGRKAVSILAAAGVLASLVYLGGLVFTPRYAVLFSNLQAAEAGTITTKLDSMKVPYRLTDQGKTIEVPQNQVYSVRIQLASNGTLENTDSGWSLFDQNQFGMTDFEQQVDYQRALQVELRNTITQMNGVQDAVVNLVIPQQSVFLQSGGTPSASVLLKLQPGASLSPDQVQGISDLVVGSVQDLKPEDVHIVDTNGNILNSGLNSKDNGQLTAAASLTQQKVTLAYDQALEQKVQAMLDQVLGPGQAKCIINADLNFDQKQTSQTTYGNGSVLSQQTTKDTGSGGAAPGAVPGTTTSTTPVTPSYASGSQSTGTYDNESTTTNNDVSSTQTSDTQAPGTVARISTAVVVNSNSNGQISQSQVQSLVAAAIGFNANRGDLVTVESMPFNTQLESNLAQQMASNQARQRQQQLIEMAAAGLLLLIILIGVLVGVLRRRRRVEYFEEEEMLAAAPAEASLTEEARKEFFSEDEKLEVIRQLARDKPEDVAEIVKVWIKEVG
ncbi:MAG TPA: flagellar basal-body MS-ring/collar protein FliF [Spirochaetia bacterium]|nr:flagellar basal-body MS-ring/collar protein FliF [Spirochaetia bacterium]